MNFSPDQIVALCKMYGPQLHVDPSIDGMRLMYAIACNESSDGRNCTPRHEPAYDVGGIFYKSSPAVQALVARFGAAAACSYGPWQIMLCNAAGYTPTELLANVDANAKAFLHFFNSYVIGAVKAHTIEQIAETYNSGNFRPGKSAGVLQYAAQIAQHYASATFA